MSAQAGHPFLVTIATYVRAPGPDRRTPGRPLAILMLGVKLDAVQPLADNVAAARACACGSPTSAAGCWQRQAAAHPA